MAKKPDQSSTQPKKNSRKELIVVAIIGLVLILLIGGIIFYFTVERPLLAPKTTLTLEPDLSLGGITISQDTLEETAKILRQRWSILGYGSPWTSFVATEKGQIIAKIPADADSEMIKLTKATGVIEFVDFGKRPMDIGAIVNTDYSYGFQKGEGTQWHTIMTGGQIHTISVYKDQSGGYEILFSLTEAGKKILTNYTTQNIDSYLGVLFDKAVIACPRIATPMTNGTGVINGQFTEQAANILVAIVRSGPLPIPLK